MLRSLSKAYHSWAFKISIWLILTGSVGVLTGMVWIASSAQPKQHALQKQQDGFLGVDPSIQLLNRPPDEMKSAVQPISFDAVIKDLRKYPSEFKDSRFVRQNAGKWTVQIMNVAEHEVVSDYLNGRGDKNQFNYFRIIDEHNQKRYVVTYGVFSSSQGAMNASKTMNFGLPKNVSAFPEEFNLYLSQMDDYEIGEAVRDFGENAPRDVKLRKTSNLLPTYRPDTSANSNTENEQETKTIKHSTDINDTLSIQEKTVVKEKPLVIEKTLPPDLTEMEQTNKPKANTPKTAENHKESKVDKKNDEQQHEINPTEE